MPDLNRDHVRPVWRAGPQPRSCEASVARMRSDPLPVRAHAPSIPSSLKHDPLPSHQSKADSSERPQSASWVQPPTPAFHVASTKRPQSESQPIQPKRKSRKPDLLRVRQLGNHHLIPRWFRCLFASKHAW